MTTLAIGDRVRIFATSGRKPHVSRYLGMTGTLVPRSARGVYRHGEDGKVVIQPDQPRPEGIPALCRAAFAWDADKVERL